MKILSDRRFWWATFVVAGLILVFAGSRFVMSENRATVESSPMTARSQVKGWRYLALGDSYTIGESVSEDERFPAQLVRKLAANGFPNGRVEIIARTGWTTDELERAIEADTPQGTFDLVTLLIGVNNQYRGRTLDEYRPEFVALLERAIAFAGDNPKRVVVVSIPDWGVTPFGKGRENVGKAIDAFNAVNREETMKRGVRYVDITPTSRMALNDLQLTAPDGLHPSGVMYERWVDLILPAAVEALEGK